MMRRLFALWVMAGMLYGHIDPAKISHSLVEIYAKNALNFHWEAFERSHACAGVLIHRGKKIAVTLMPNLYDSFYSDLHVKFVDGTCTKGTVIYKDPVLGFSFIRLEEVPPSARGVAFSSMDVPSTGWFYTTMMQDASSWFACLVDLGVSPRSRLYSFKFLKVVEDSLYGGVLASKCGNIVGLNANGKSLSFSGLYVPASFIRNALQRVLDDPNYQPYYVDVQTRTISILQALDGGFLSQEMWQDIQKEYDLNTLEIVVMSNIDGLRVGDIILKVDGQWVTHYLKFVEATRHDSKVRLEFVREGERKSEQVSCHQFPRCKDGVLVCNGMQWFYMQPALALKYPNHRVGSLLCKYDQSCADYANLYGHEIKQGYESCVDAVHDAPESMHELKRLIDQQGVVLTVECDPYPGDLVLLKKTCEVGRPVCEFC